MARKPLILRRAIFVFPKGRKVAKWENYPAWKAKVVNQANFGPGATRALWWSAAKYKEQPTPSCSTYYVLNYTQEVGNFSKTYSGFSHPGPRNAY